MPRNKTKRPLPKRVGRVGKFPTPTEDHVAELRQKAYAREGRNAIIARAILKELARPLKKRESDRALGRKLSVDHRTIGRWRERIKGQRPRSRVVSRRKFLGACQTLGRLNVVVMSQKLEFKDIQLYVGPAYHTLHRIQNGPRTMPERQRKVPRK